jgi:hypothetical protein
MPFHAEQACTLPSGAFLTVKLNRSLVPARLHSGDLFAGSLAGPMQVDGRTVIDAGAEVSGRVESAQTSSGQLGQAGGSGKAASKGYVQMTLTGIIVDGKKLSLQTSSLFARATSSLRSNVASGGTNLDAQSDAVRVQKGSRLTFRLTAPITMDDSHSVAAMKCY